MQSNKERCCALFVILAIHEQYLYSSHLLTESTIVMLFYTWGQLHCKGTPHFDKDLSTSIHDRIWKFIER